MNKKILLILFIVFQISINCLTVEDVLKNKDVFNFDQILKTKTFENFELSGDRNCLFNFNYDNGLVRIYDISNKKYLKEFYVKGNNFIISSDGKYVATSIENIVYIWSVFSGELYKTIDLKNGSFSPIIFTPDNKKLLIADYQNYKVGVFDKKKKKIIGKFIPPVDRVNEMGFNNMSFSINGNYLLLKGNDWEMTIVDTRTWKIVSNKGTSSDEIGFLDNDVLYEKLENEGNYFMFSKIIGFKEFFEYKLNSEDEISIGETSKSFIVKKENRLYQYIVNTKKENLVFTGNIVGFSMSPKGNLLAVITDDKKLSLIDLNNVNNKKVYNLDSKFKDYINELKWINDNNLLLSYDSEDEKGGEIFTKKIVEIIYPNDIDGFARADKPTEIYINNKIAGNIPKDFVVLMENGELKKPIFGNIENKNLEKLYKVKESYAVLINEDENLYKDSTKSDIVGIIKKGTILRNVIYSNELHMFYIEDNLLKGWIDLDKLELLSDIPKKLVVLKEIPNSINEVKYMKVSDKSYYAENLGWISKNDYMDFFEENKGKKIYSLKNENKVYENFENGEIFTLNLGEQVNLLGEVKEYYLIENGNKKGWVSKENMTDLKFDLEIPKLTIESINIDENGLLTIDGEVSDDIEIDNLKINDNKVELLETRKDEDKEIGKFSFQWLLLKGMKNNIKIELKDKTGKCLVKYIKFDENLNKEE